MNVEIYPFYSYQTPAIALMLVKLSPKYSTKVCPLSVSGNMDGTTEKAFCSFVRTKAADQTLQSDVWA